MNDLFAVEPSACENSAELRLLLDKFGPYSGRYVATFPQSWEREVDTFTAHWSPMERMRALTMIVRARERRALIPQTGRAYKKDMCWVDNLEAVQVTPQRFDNAVVNRSNAGKFQSMDEFDPSPVLGKYIEASAENFVQVSRTLISISPEIFFVDPYFDPCSDNYFRVLKAMLFAASRTPCTSIQIWARHKTLIDEHGRRIDELRKFLNRAKQDVGFASRKVKLLLIDDAASSDRLHARFLLSIKGAISFDQGFGELSGKRKMAVSVVAKDIHEELISRFIEMKNDLKIVQELII